MAIGTGIQMIGQFAANKRQAKAQLENARFLEKQADFARSAMNRSIRIAEQEYANKYGQQAGAYAASGVDVGSGSASLLLAGTYASALEELNAIRKRGELDIELARSRANLNRDEAMMLQSPGFNLLQAGGTFLSNYTASEGFGQGFPASFAPETPPPSGAGNQLTYFPQGTNRAL